MTEPVAVMGSVFQWRQGPAEPIVFEALYDDVVPPTPSTDWSAGLDARAHIVQRYIVILHGDGSTSEISGTDELWLRPGSRVLIPLGFKAALPEGWEMQVRPRSGLALKWGVTVLNTPGTIDADFPGEWGVVLMNHGNDTLRIAHGDRIAQLVLAPVWRALWTPGKVEQRTQRMGGLGSTGHG